MEIYVGKYSAYEKDYIGVSIFHQGHLLFSSDEDAVLCESNNAKMRYHPYGWPIKKDSRYDGPFMLEDETALPAALKTVIDVLKERNKLGREPVDSNSEERLKELQIELKEPLAEVEEIIYKNFLSR
jgi:hypothetical protein